MGGEHLSHLRFADHIVKNIIVELTKKVGLHMNYKKIQVIINKYIQNRDLVIKIENEVIEHVNDYVYLGQLVSTTLSIEEHIKRRIRVGWQAFG